jgi:hypothetical protein
MVMAGSRPSTDFTKQLFYAVAFLFAINSFSAILFMCIVRRPVYDDAMNMSDVRAYAARGISVSAIRAQRNTPGPTSFVWMASGARLIGHDELLDARVAVLFSWVLLVILTMAGVRYSEWPQLWYGALIATLIFPHSLTAMATALTEGPALLFALLGALAWTEMVSRESRFGSASLVLAIGGGLAMGLAVTCRQYFLALLPAAGLLALFLIVAQSATQKLASYVHMILPLIFAVVPPLLMVLTWRGITSPGMASGASYSNYQAGWGLAIFRPVDVAFYTALYLLPLSFPAMWQIPEKVRWPLLPAALAGGLAAAHFSEYLVNPGPLHSFLEAASRIPAGATAVLGLIAGAAVYNAVAVVLVLWNQRSNLRTCAPVMFSTLVVVFFIAEQFGVGGNIPFYDRYVLQLAPFLGIIGFWVSPRLTRLRVIALAGLLALSHGMLWRYAFMVK